jgi:hypothetical protein
MMSVNGSTGGVPNGTHYEVSVSIDKGHLILNVELENSLAEKSLVNLLFNFSQAMELRDAIEKAVWTISQ